MFGKELVAEDVDDLKRAGAVYNDLPVADEGEVVV